ncbi:MAG: S-adenosylmethionine decarboxylase proenzyme [Deltaproteobacteria bacterium]|nr:MAG: S-adenosylmethionine decarboxylase proenzyme [Deltaproteobacteria bacterium]
MKSLGKHIILEVHGVDSKLLNDIKKIEDIMSKAVRLCGATIIKPFFHQFSPHGVSGVIVIAESHFSIHTWPEYGYAALDLFTCGDQISPDDAVGYLKKEMNAGQIHMMEIKRGTLDIPPEELKHK